MTSRGALVSSVGEEEAGLFERAAAQGLHLGGWQSCLREQSLTEINKVKMGPPVGSDLSARRVALQGLLRRFDHFRSDLKGAETDAWTDGGPKALDLCALRKKRLHSVVDDASGRASPAGVHGRDRLWPTAVIEGREQHRHTVCGPHPYNLLRSAREEPIRCLTLSTLRGQNLCAVHLLDLDELCGGGRAQHLLEASAVLSKVRLRGLAQGEVERSARAL